MAKSADFAADFAKSADFFIESNRAVSELLAALEQGSGAGQSEEIRKRAQKARHILETVDAQWTTLAERAKALGGDALQSSAANGSAGGLHVHVHLHLGGDGGLLVSRSDK